MVWLLIVVALLALFFGMWTRHNLAKQTIAAVPLSLASGTLFPLPRPLHVFSLQDQNKQKFTEKNLQGHWTYVFFGFTHCPMVCPTALATLKQFYQDLVHNHVQPLPQIVFISVDPERDTPAVIKKYLSGFNTAFVGATGSKKELDALTQQFNVVYAKIMPEGDASHYSIEHSGTILLVNPQGEMFAVFSAPQDADKMAEDYQKIIGGQ